MTAKEFKKLIKYYQQADDCLSRKKAQKLLKKVNKLQNKIKSHQERS